MTFDLSFVKDQGCAKVVIVFLNVFAERVDERAREGECAGRPECSYVAYNHMCL